MPKLYEYTAHAGSTIRRDTIEADDEKAVRQALRQQGLFPIEIKVAPKQKFDLIARLQKALRPADPAAAQKKKVQDLRPAKKKTYIYTAMPFAGGDQMTGEISATEERLARQLLRERSLFPIKLGLKPFYHDFLPSASKAAASIEAKKKKDQASQDAFEDLLERILPPQFTQKKIPLKEMVFYTQQMATMMDAGLSIAQTMDILSGNVKHRRLLKINTAVQSKIYEGVSLSEAFGEHRHFLPEIFVELMSIGEQSGNMEETTRRIADYLEKTAETQRKVKGALSYPSVLIGLIVLIVIGLMLFVVPTFVKLFTEFKLDLPMTTRILLGTSSFMSHYWWTLPLYYFGGQTVISWFFKTALGKGIWDRFEYKVPLLGNLAYKVVISRMLYNLALFLKCGVPITTTLESVRESTGNAILATRIEEIRLGVVQGARLATLFEASGLFPPFVNHLLVAGEESGATDELILKGAKYVDQEIEAAIKALTSAIEPIMTVLIAGIVLFILGSLYMPLLGLMSNTGKVAG